jgi:peptidoglycan/xylan/chitin deacetylase (PgdA/CDA1 family)
MDRTGTSPPITGPPRVAEVLVLCYHAVSDSWHASESVTPHALERQLSYLRRRGWRAATFAEAVLDPPAPRTVAITFDDAFTSVKRYALPILSELGLTATVFAPTEYVTSEKRCTWSGLESWAGTPHAGELAPMSWQDLGELADASWEIGSHTCTHPHLTRLDDASLRRELVHSREESVRHLGRPFQTIAYPYGDVDDRVADFARRAGYRAGAALSSHLRDLGPYRWPRTGIYQLDAFWRFLLKTAPTVRRVRATRVWRG